MGGGDAIGMRGDGPTQGWGGQGTRGAHVEHVRHGRDAGRVEAERLVKRLRVLPSRKGGHEMREEVRPGGREGVGWQRRRRHARGGSDSRLWGGRARAERTRNMAAMSVTLDVSKLSGWLNALASCRVERRACDAGRGAARQTGRLQGVGCGGDALACTGGGGDSRLCGKGTRGAHVEHALHGRDAGRVEAERLVERPRALPSRKAGMRCGKRCGPGGV